MTIEDGHLDIDRGPKDLHTGPDSVEKFSYDYALSESATDRLHDLVVVEKERLQRRVEELETALSDERTLRGIDQRTSDKSLEYAAEQRKRAEEAERAKFEAIAKAQEDWFALDAKHAAAIEKARQEERARIAAFLRSDEHGNLEWCNCADSVEKLNDAPTS